MSYNEIRVVIYTFCKKVGIESYKKQHRIMDGLFAQAIGRQTLHGLTENRKKVKGPFGKTWAIFFSFHGDALPTRSPEDFIA
jgi:hypothetical protein